MMLYPPVFEPGASLDGNVDATLTVMLLTSFCNGSNTMGEGGGRGAITFADTIGVDLTGVGVEFGLDFGV